MSDLWLGIHIDGEGKELEARIDKLEERIDASGVGEAVGRMNALEEFIVIVEMPPACTEADLPAKMQALREILVGEGLDGIVEIPKDDDGADEGDDDDDGEEVEDR